MNIYLDIDGTILANDKQPALHASEFIEYIVSNFPTYWLTTHVRQKGDDPLPMLARFFDQKTLDLLKQVRPTMWQDLKTEALDFSQPFKWIDDDCLETEMEVLRQHNTVGSWVKIDLSQDPHQLAKLIPQ